MRALCWYGPGHVEVEDVPDPRILSPRDAIVRVTAASICGSDLHVYDGLLPGVRRGDILGHECMGEVVEVGPAVKNLSVGDRVVVPCTIACGACFYCKRDLFSQCDNSNPGAGLAEKAMGYATAGVFGLSHLMGGYAGSQAEYVRVPFADVGPLKVPDGGVPDDRLLFLSDVFPTGYQAAEACGIEPGDTVAVWGCGPVGQFVVKSCFLLGAERVIAIDRIPERLLLAADAGAEPLNFEHQSVPDLLRDMTGGRGPDCCIDAVGMEAHGLGLSGFVDRARQALALETDRTYVLREMITCCRKGGRLAIGGVYAGMADRLPIGAVFNKGLTIKASPVNPHRSMRPLLELILRDEVDPSFIVTHHMSLEEAPKAYRMFRDKEDGMIKAVLDPRRRPRPDYITTAAREEPEAAQEYAR